MTWQLQSFTIFNPICQCVWLNGTPTADQKTAKEKGCAQPEETNNFYDRLSTNHSHYRDSFITTCLACVGFVLNDFWRYSGTENNPIENQPDFTFTRWQCIPRCGCQGIALRLLRCSERSALLGGCHAVAFSSYQKSPPPLNPWHWKSGENLDFCVWYALSYIAHFSSVSRRLWELSSQLKLTRAKVVKICSNKKRQL